MVHKFSNMVHKSSNVVHKFPNVVHKFLHVVHKFSIMVHKFGGVVIQFFTMGHSRVFSDHGGINLLDKKSMPSAFFTFFPKKSNVIFANIAQ